MRAEFYPAGFFAIAGSLAGAIVGRRLGRFKPPPDRSIIGCHLVADVLLLPARATLLVWDHLNARIVLSRTEREEAWRLMRTISKMRRGGQVSAWPAIFRIRPGSRKCSRRSSLPDGSACIAARKIGIIACEAIKSESSTRS